MNDIISRHITQITPLIVYALVRFSLKPVLIYSISHLSVSFFNRTDLKPITCVTRGWLFVLRQKSKKKSKNETPHLIQPIEKIRIFAQSLLKIAPSRARFAMLGCYIRKNQLKRKRMKKSFLLWMGVVLMMVVGMSSCSSDDDDYSYVQEFGDNNNKENFIGT